MKTDVLVIGSGLAGLSFALRIAEKYDVCLITKKEFDDTNTIFAQGGIASVMDDDDSFEKHVEDTYLAGHKFGNKKVIEKVIRSGPSAIEMLTKWGTTFDKKNDGDFDLSKEGGHTEKRILHHKDKTGNEIQLSLEKEVLDNPRITVYENFFAVDLITQHHLGEIVTRKRKDIECYGAYCLDIKNNQIISIESKVTYLATGGIGSIYQKTTNPDVATGDGVAMAYRAKAICKDMEFIQFHPTALYEPGKRRTFLITEALRGHGARLCLADGSPFMEKYDERASLAPRDIVAQAIDTELKISGDEHVYLDCRHLDIKELRMQFPTVYQKCTEIGLNLQKDMIPVVPSMHYMCGGIDVDEYGRTSIRNLFAGGESARTGMHGANRLASNSLLEAISYAMFSSEYLLKINGLHENKRRIPEWDDKGTSHPEEMILITQNHKELQAIMSNYVGIVRSDLRLDRALRRLVIIYRETEALYRKSKISVKICELRNSINVAYLIIKMAQNQKKNIGLHFNIDNKKEF